MTNYKSKTTASSELTATGIPTDDTTTTRTYSRYSLSAYSAKPYHRSLSSSSTGSLSSSHSLSPTSTQHTNGSAADEGQKTILEVELNKGAVGLGFCIEGGKCSPLGDRPITVKRLFKGGYNYIKLNKK